MFAGRLPALLVVMAAGAGCAAPGADDKALMASAKLDFEAGRPALAEQKLDRICESRRAEAPAEAFYLRGLARCGIARGNPTVGRSGDVLFDQARTDLESAQSIAQKNKDDELVRLTHAALGHTAFFRRWADYPRAVRHYRLGLPDESLWATGSEAEELVFYLAVAEQRSGDWEGASKRFNTLLTKFPRSRYEARARTHLAASAFSVQVGTYSMLTNAAEQQNRLVRQGLPALVENRPTTGGERHIVKIGRYRTYGEALAQVPRIKSVLAPYNNGRDAEAIVVP